ncbi:uncharacterized protein C12orf50 homolog [Pluvialis apricaria]
MGFGSSPQRVSGDGPVVLTTVQKWRGFEMLLLDPAISVWNLVPENCFLLQQKYSNISCFWEKQPLGCLRISRAFHHSKPCYINGLVLPPDNMQFPHPPPRRLTAGAAVRTTQARCWIPRNLLKIFPTDVSDCVPKTAADIEEERAIKEVCYISGEYYRIQYPHKHQSRKTASSCWKNELLPSEAAKRDLQKGKYFPPSRTMFTSFSITVTGRN